jgi:hypothetical protein
LTLDVPLVLRTGRTNGLTMLTLNRPGQFNSLSNRPRARHTGISTMNGNSFAMKLTDIDGASYNAPAIPAITHAGRRAARPEPDTDSRLPFPPGTM